MYEKEKSIELNLLRQSLSPQRQKKQQEILGIKLNKELLSVYLNLGIDPQNPINYLQFVFILQSLNYISKNKASDEESRLLVDAWNSLKT